MKVHCLLGCRLCGSKTWANGLVDEDVNDLELQDHGEWDGDDGPCPHDDFEIEQEERYDPLEEY